MFLGVPKRFTKRMALKYLTTSSLKTKSFFLKKKWVCSRHFKSRDYVTSLAGRKRTLKTTAVPSVFFWKEGSPVKRKSPKKRSPVKRKNLARESETTTANAVNANTSSTLQFRRFLFQSFDLHVFVTNSAL